MTIRNRYLRSIKKLFWDLPDLDASVDQLLKAYRYPGASLRLIAANLGVADIVEEDLPFEGGIFESGGQTIIKLNAKSSISRQRFTLAHELGHLIFVERLFMNRECMEDPELERACNHLAVELLMPRQDVSGFVAELGTPTPEKLKAIAGRFGVSFEVAARRLEHLKLWKHSMGMWEYHGKAKQLWFVGKKLWHHTPHFRAFDLAGSSQVCVSTIETLPPIGYCEYSYGIALQMLKLGKNLFLGVINTSR